MEIVLQPMFFLLPDSYTIIHMIELQTLEINVQGLIKIVALQPQISTQADCCALSPVRNANQPLCAIWIAKVIYLD